jgi:hypothetical protein
MIQKKLSRFCIITLVILGLSFSNHLSAAPAIKTGLLISQIKVTADNQFVSLYNNTDQAIDMSTVSLMYFNSFKLSQATSTKNIQLTGQLAAHSYYIVNDGSVDICYRAKLQSTSLGFSTKAGMVEVVRLNQSDNGIDIVSQDFVAWSSGGASGGQTLPVDSAFLQRQQAGGSPLPNGKWQPVKPNDSNPCQLVTSDKLSSPAASSARLLPAAPPAATIVSLDESSLATGSPNNGLKAPSLTELLPNPAKPQTDANDEFIEIYNPNSQSFDLKGFKIQTAAGPAATKHTYTFPGGTKVAAKSYAAYPSANITISLTNSSGIVWLLDPSGKIISQTDAYADAKDGQTWALANGKWYWTSSPTPNTTNIIKASAQTKKSNSPGVGTVKGIATGAASGSNDASQNKDKPKSNSPVVLVGVGVLAVVYGLYEYRRDLANWFQKRQRNGDAGRADRPKPKGRRDY